MKLLQIYNFAPHYRAAIFQLMDSALGCDFVFGDKVEDIKKMDYRLLSHKVTEVHNIRFRHCYYQRGVPTMIRQKYDTFLILGEPRCIRTWLFLVGSLFYPRKRIFLWSHGWLGKENGMKRMIGRLFYYFCDGAFIYNERSRELMVKGGIPGNKLTTIYNSLDYDKQLAIRKTLQPSSIYKDHFKNENKNIVFIGRLTAIKRLDLLINAVSEMRRRDEIVNVTLIGDGAEREKLEMMVRQQGLNDQVWFMGSSYDEQLNAEMIYNADLCVSPGNIGLTAIHVLMFGCPAITNDDFNHQMPEFETIVDGKTGSFFQSDGYMSLADTISVWFASHECEREQVRSNCYNIIDSKWNPHNQIRILKEKLGQ